MELRPAERGQAAVTFVEQEAVRVEPRLALALAQHVDRPPALFRVTGERPVVDGQEGVLVAAGNERAGDNLDGEARRQRAAQLQERPRRRQTRRGGDLAVEVGRVEGPPLHRATAIGGHDVERRREQAGADRRVVTVGGVDDELDRACRRQRGELGVPDEPVAVVDHDGGER